MIWSLDGLDWAATEAAGGKGRTLARLRQAGYRVPAGFVVSEEAFQAGRLRPEGWDRVQTALSTLRQGEAAMLLAVRSSAVGEDGAGASFAGLFETVLNVVGDEAVRTAVEQVFQSREGDRVAAYAAARGEVERPAMAVIVQRQVAADWAGVLFTADPLTGSHERLVGNVVAGLGERLVSGDVSGESFALTRPSGQYAGPTALRPFAKPLFRLGERLATELGGPQDIEWAVADGQLYLLQARPITTMQAYNPATGEWNDSRQGDYLWSNANFGEAIPGVMTPLTWSLIEIYGDVTLGNPFPGRHPFFGNIAGRFYVNLSLFASLFTALGFSRERMNQESEALFGNVPKDVAIPIIPFGFMTLARRFLPFAIRAARRRRKNAAGLVAFVTVVSARTKSLREGIAEVAEPGGLALLWRERFEPLLREAYAMLQAGTSAYENAYRPLHRRLADEVGERDANHLLSGVAADGASLASLGPLLGLWQVQAGQLSRADYLARYGHRGVHEFEVSWLRPAEDPAWLERQLATLGDEDVPDLLAKRAAEKAAAWERYQVRFPKATAKTDQQLAAAAAAARQREAIRSEVTRLLAAARHFALEAGQLTGEGDAVFFLHLPELLALLDGDDTAVALIPRRREAYARQSALPPYPALIRGRFDAALWAADPVRRSDRFGVGEGPAVDETAVIRGLPGSAGVVEGPVRRLDSPDDGHLLQPGEILVAVTTNVGWTPIFPRAAAIVTDVGAPLSHAAIVARELGLPAVIGTGNATMRLRTGDWVRVDGGRGTVERIEDGGPGTRGG